METKMTSIPAETCPWANVKGLLYVHTYIQGWRVGTTMVIDPSVRPREWNRIMRLAKWLGDLTIIRSWTVPPSVLLDEANDMAKHRKVDSESKLDTTVVELASDVMHEMAEQNKKEGK